MGAPENSIFTAEKVIGWLIIYSIFMQNLVQILRNFYINSSSWNNYDSWFFSFLKSIRLWNFKFDSWITNHEWLIQTLSESLEKFLANNFALSGAKDNTCRLLNRGGFVENTISNLPKSQEPNFWEEVDSVVLFAYASLAASRTLLQ